MSFVLIDPVSGDKGWYPEHEMFDTLDQVESAIEERADGDYAEHPDWDVWVNKLEIREIGDKVPVRINREIRIHIG